MFYSSNLTAGKEVLLAGTTFSKRELVRASATSGPGFLLSEMNSEHCPGAKAYMEVIKAMPALLGEDTFCVTSMPKPHNPMRQQYVFYNSEDTLAPIVDVEEVVWEPRYTATVAAKFLDNCINSLDKSVQAWRLRCELERMRQGRFTSLEEALASGWHRVSVTVVAARIGTSKAQRERLHLSYSNRNKRTSANPTNRSQSVASTGSSGVHHGLPSYQILVPILDLTSAPSSPKATGKSIVGHGAGPVQPSLQQSQGKARRADDTAPSSCVVVSIEDRCAAAFEVHAMTAIAPTTLTHRVPLHCCTGRGRSCCLWGAPTRSTTHLRPTSAATSTAKRSAIFSITLECITRNSATSEIQILLTQRLSFLSTQHQNALAVAEDTVELQQSRCDFHFYCVDTPDRDSLLLRSLSTMGMRHNDYSGRSDSKSFALSETSDLRTELAEDNHPTSVDSRDASSSVTSSSLRSFSGSLREQMQDADATVDTFSCQGVSSCFRRYIPCCSEASVRFDYCIEEAPNVLKK